MSRNNKISGYNNISGENNSVNDSINVSGSKIDNSITKKKEISNIKQITRRKNSKKKKEKITTTEILNPNNKRLYNQNPSYNRENIQKMYENNKSETMIAYVQSKKFSNKRNRCEYVLYNVCTDRDFMSDHVWVYPDIDLDYYIGKCIQFNAKAYKYNDEKYSLDITNINELNINKPFNFGFRLNHTTENLYPYIINANDDKLYEIVNILALTLECYSSAMFGSKRFIIGMIFNMFYLGSSNHELSEHYDYNLGLSKRLLIWIFSDIIYKLEEFRQNSYRLIINIDNEIELCDPFTIINNRVIEICMSLQNPIIKGECTKNYGKVFDEFCIAHEIDKKQAEKFIYTSTKRLKLKKSY